MADQQEQTKQSTKKQHQNDNDQKANWMLERDKRQKKKKEERASQPQNPHQNLKQPTQQSLSKMFIQLDFMSWHNGSYSTRSSLKVDNEQSPIIQQYYQSAEKLFEEQLSTFYNSKFFLSLFILCL